MDTDNLGQSRSKTKSTKLLYFLLLLLTMMATVGRLLFLEADFPKDITWSATLYTDEGWYTNAAVSYILTGKWYVEGDFNPIVNMPLFFLVHALAFKIFGLSLFTARLTIAIFFILTLIFTYILASKYLEGRAAILTVLIMSVSFTTFAYSRLAILEMPLISLLVLSILVALSWERGGLMVAAVLSSILFCAACLAKATALNAFPVLLLAFYSRAIPRREKYLGCVVLSVVVGILLSGYYFIASQLYPEDFTLFSRMNFYDRLVGSVSSFLLNIPWTFWNGLSFDRILFPTTLFVVPLLILLSSDFRRNKLVQVCIAWTIFHLAVLCLNTYQPNRYYLPLVVPLSMLFSYSFLTLYDRFRLSSWSLLIFLIPAFFIILNASRIVLYLSSPQYTFLKMAEDVGRRAKESGIPKLWIMGDIANSVSLATGIPSINADLGTRSLDWKLQEYCPSYLVSLGKGTNMLHVIKRSASVDELAAYDVYGNYYKNRKVYLYRLSLINCSGLP